jgi:CHAD domain
MQLNQHSFLIPDEQSIPSLVSSLEETFPLRAQAETVYHRVFYDTFDWRLTRSGSSLERHDDGRSARIYWQADKDSRPRIQLGFSKVPKLAADLPAGDFRQQLEAVTSVRELSPRIKIRVKRQSYVVLDEDEKVVVRLYFDVFWYSPSKLKAARVLTRRLVTTAVKGYAEDYQRIRDFFTDTSQPMSLRPAQDNVLKLALITSGISTTEHTTSLKLRLDPDMPDEQALKEILLRLLDILQQNTSGSIKGRDKEFTHNYRDTVGKIRVLMQQLDQTVTLATDTGYQDLFSKLDLLTKPVRDIDVFLILLDDYQRNPDIPGRAQINPLYDYLLQARAEAQESLAAELKSSHYRNTIRQWRDALRHSESENAMADRSAEPVCKLADELLRDVNQHTLKQGKAVIKNSKAETLHAGNSQELHKTLTHLSYLIESFSSLYPAVEMRVLVQTLSEVQDSLERYVELDDQIGRAKAFIEHSEDKAAIEAAEQLVQMLEQEQGEAVKHFKDSFKNYASARNQKKLKELFVDYHQGKMKL